MIPARDMAKMNGNDGGNGSSSELAIGQPNIMIDGELQPLDTSEGEMARIRDHELMESRSGSDNGGSGDDHDRNQRPGKKRVHRHTPYQIQELEAFFKACPHPDDKHRKEIGRQLGLEPLQVKFWFQNKRTQIKAQQERHENTLRRAENERLRADNRRLRDNLCNATCPNCGGPAAVGGDIMCLDDDHHLWFENARLREEVDRISAIAAKYVGKPVMDCPLLSPPVTPHSLDLEIGPFGDHPGIGAETNGSDRELFRSVAEVDIPAIMELAVAAMEELMKMAQMGEPLWMPKTDGSSFLNEEEYVRTFPGGIIGSKPLGFRTEASRESDVVIINSNKVVEILMDVNQWSTMFSAIVSRVATLEVVSAGVARNYNGALQIMTAEFQVPSPLVPTRKSYFLRYSKQHINHTWVVVDVSFDGLRPTPLEECRRRPSGCLIQEMPNGHSKVTWVEHVEVEDRCVHNLYRSLVGGGFAFGAKRWVSTLIRQCERQSSTVATNVPTNSIVSQEGRQSLLKLAERMVMSFSAGVGASTAHKWTNLSVNGDKGVRVMTHKSVDDPGRPPGIVLNAATSFWLPNSPRRVFNFLCDYNSRSEWDILSNGGAVQRMAHIANGPESDNCVSLL